MNRKTQWEIFQPSKGRAIMTTRFRLIAALICAIAHRLDYAPTGKGWVR